MKVLLIDNLDGGFADRIELEAGTTVRQLFDERTDGGDPADFLIRVNRETVPADHVLADGDRVSITPTKIEGAAG